MRLVDFFRRSRPSAPAAKERLQILLAHERTAASGPDFLPDLQKDLLKVIAGYVEIDEDKVSVQVERGDGIATLEVNVELPAARPGTARRRA